MRDPPPPRRGWIAHARGLAGGGDAEHGGGDGVEAGGAGGRPQLDRHGPAGESGGCASRSACRGSRLSSRTTAPAGRSRAPAAGPASSTSRGRSRRRTAAGGRQHGRGGRRHAAATAPPGSPARWPATVRTRCRAGAGRQPVPREVAVEVDTVRALRTPVGAVPSGFIVGTSQRSTPAGSGSRSSRRTTRSPGALVTVHAADARGWSGSHPSSSGARRRLAGPAPTSRYRTVDSCPTRSSARHGGRSCQRRTSSTPARPTASTA